MPELNEQQIDLISAYIKQHGVAQDELHEDLLDHVCTSIEERIEQGDSFETAFQHTIALFGPGGLQQVQTQTFELLTEMNATMKKLTFGFGLTSTFLLLAGTIFKIMHWPGASVMVVLGVALLVFGYLPMILNHKLKESEKGDKLMHVLGFFGLSVTSVGVLFKIMHWPGAAVMLLGGIAFLAVGYVPIYFYKRYQTSVNKPITFSSSLIATACLIMIFALMTMRNSGWYERGVMTVNDQLIESNYSTESLNAGLREKSAWAGAGELASKTDATVSYIEGLKTHLIAKTKEITKEDSESMELHELDIKHNSTTPTAVLLGESEEVLRTGPFSAQELKDNLNDYANYISRQYPEELRAAMARSFVISPELYKDGEYSDGDAWELHHFKYVPLFAVVSNLSKWQMEVRQMETQLLMYHGSQPAASDPPS